MQIHIDDRLYQGLSDYSAYAHEKTERIIEKVLTNFLNDTTKKKKSPHPSWPKEFIEFKGNPNFPDINELRAGLKEDEAIEI